MTADEVIALIEKEADPRGIAHREKRYPDSRLRSFGVGLTKLRKLAKKVGRDHDLALQLWQSDVYEARVIDEPDRITREQVEELGEGQLAHVFSSCDVSLAKVPFVQDLADDWVKSEDPVRRSCGYGLIYELSSGGGGAASSSNARDGEVRPASRRRHSKSIRSGCRSRSRPPPAASTHSRDLILYSFRIR